MVGAKDLRGSCKDFPEMGSQIGRNIIVNVVAVLLVGDMTLWYNNKTVSTSIMSQHEFIGKALSVPFQGLFSSDSSSEDKCPQHYVPFFMSEDIFLSLTPKGYRESYASINKEIGMS